MKLVLYVLFIFLKMATSSDQKGNNKAEDINAILDQLIKQTEESKDNTTKGMLFDVKEKSGNESKIIYVKTHMRLGLPNIIIPNITGVTKAVSNNHNKDDQSKYDTVSEEIVLEIEAGDTSKSEPLIIQEIINSDNNNPILRSAFPNDYLENDLQPQRAIDTYVPGMQNEPNLLSRYPEIMIDPVSNNDLAANNAKVKEIAKDLFEKQNQVNRDQFLPESNTNTPRLIDRLNEQFHQNQELKDLSRLIYFKKSHPENLYGPIRYPVVLETLQYPRKQIFNNLPDNLASISLDNALKHNVLYQSYLDGNGLVGNNPPPVGFIPPADDYSLPYHVAQPQNLIRTVIQHQGAPMHPGFPWQSGTKCCSK